MRDTERKCTTCKFNATNYKGTYCNCIHSSEYGLYSVYGWCEEYVPLSRFDVNDHRKRKDFILHDMELTFDIPVTRTEAEEALEKALAEIGVVHHTGYVN